MAKAKNPVEKAAAAEPYLAGPDETSAWPDPSEVVAAGLSDPDRPVQPHPNAGGDPDGNDDQ